MRKLIIGILFSLAIFNAWALDIDCSNDSKVAVGLRLNTSTFPSLDVEITGEYRPFRYVGANAGIIFITPFSNQTNTSDYYNETNPDSENETETYVWEINSYRDACYRLALKAGLQFTTPAIMLSKNEMGLSLRVSPGITIPLPANKVVTATNYNVFTREEFFGDEENETDNEMIWLFTSKEDFKNTGAKTIYWYARAELVVEYEEQWEFSVGYTYSNFDIYGGSRNIIVHGSPIVLGDKEPHHSISLGLSFKF